MDKRKKWIGITILLIMLFLTACGGGSGNTVNTANKGNGNDTAASENSANEPAADEETKANNEAFTIRLGGWFIDDRQFMKDFKANVEAAYKEKYPNATIQWDVLLGATYFDKLKAELASATAPDVFFHQGTVVQYADAGYLEDLSAEPWASSLLPAAEREVKRNGKVYGGGLGLNASGLWYNKKIFSDLGIEAPKTWGDILAAGDKIKAAGITPIAAGFKDQWTASLFFDLMMQSIAYENNKQFTYDIYNGKISLEGPDFTKGMQQFEELTSRGFFNKSILSLDWPQSAELFTSGKAAMIVQGPWMPGTAQENFDKKGHAAFDLGYVPLVTESGYYNLVLSMGETLSVNAKTELKQQAKDLVAVIMSEKVLAPFSVGNGSIPPIKGIEVEYPSPALNEMMNFVNNGESSLGYGYIPESAKSSLIETVSKIVSGIKFNPKDLAEAERKAEKDRATLNKPPGM